MLAMHSIWRWVVVVVGVIALVKLALGLIQKRPFTGLDRTLSMLFSTSVDIQVVLGILVIVTSGFFTRERGEHIVMMVLALIAVHLPARWRAAPDQVRFRNTLIAFVVALVFIFIGVALLNNGAWARIAPLFILP
jgi:hypothetical protein